MILILLNWHLLLALHGTPAGLGLRHSCAASVRPAPHDGLYGK